MPDVHRFSPRRGRTICKIPLRIRRSRSYHCYDVEEHRLVLYLLRCFDTAGDYIASDSDTMVCPLFLFNLLLMTRLTISGISTSLLFPIYFTVSLGRSHFPGLELPQIRLGRITNGSCESATNPFACMCCVVDKHALLIVEVVLSSVLVLSRLWMAFGRFGCADGEFQGRKEIGFFVERMEGWCLNCSWFFCAVYILSVCCEFLVTLSMWYRIRVVL